VNRRHERGLLFLPPGKPRTCQGAARARQGAARTRQVGVKVAGEVLGNGRRPILRAEDQVEKNLRQRLRHDPNAAPCDALSGLRGCGVNLMSQGFALGWYVMPLTGLIARHYHFHHLAAPTITPKLHNSALRTGPDGAIPSRGRLWPVSHFSYDQILHGLESRPLGGIDPRCIDARNRIVTPRHRRRHHDAVLLERSYGTR